MPLTFPVSLPVGVGAPPAWPHYQSSDDGLYHAYPHWLGLDYVREPDGGIVAAISSPAAESKLSKLTVWRASDETGAVDAAKSVEVEPNEVYSQALLRRPDGILDLFYMLRTVVAPAEGVLLHRVSGDGGRTWGASEDVAPAAAVGPLSMSVRGAGDVRSVRDIFIPGLAACPTRDGLLFLAVQAAAPAEAATTWLGGADVSSGRWSFGEFRESSLHRPEMAVAHPWGLIEVSSNLSTRGFGVFTKTSDTAAAAVGPTSPGCLDYPRGGFHRTYMTASPPTPPAWQVSTGPLGVSPMPVWAHQQVPTFYAPIQDTGGDFYVTSAARMSIRRDGTLDLFHVAPGGVPTITRLRNTSEAAAPTQAWE